MKTNTCSLTIRFISKRLYLLFFLSIASLSFASSGTLIFHGPRATLPLVYNVTGGGNYCAGSPGLAVGLDGSDQGITYTLLLNNTPTTNILQGTGQFLDFGLQTAGSYTVLASGISGNILMNGTAIITEHSVPEVRVKAGANRVCSGTEVTYYAFTQNVLNPVYQWYKSYTPVGNNEESFTYEPAPGDVIQVTVTSGGCTGFSDQFYPIVYPLNADIIIDCTSNNVVTGTPVTFHASTFNTGSQSVINWYVNYESVNVHDLEFTYIPQNQDVVEATVTVGNDVPCLSQNLFTSNSILMSVCNSAPQPFSVYTENEFLCLPGEGVIKLSDSEQGVTYTVYVSFNDTINFTPDPFSSPAVGTGKSMEFPVSAGNYKIQASNACFSTWMSGVCTLDFYNTACPVVVSKNDVLAGTQVTLSTPPLGQGSAQGLYYWSKNGNEGFIGESYTYIPENGDFIRAEMILPCRDYDSENNTVVMFVREPEAHYTTWTGTYNNNWTKPQNWDNGLPDETSIVTIPEEAPHFPTLTVPTVCASLIMSNSSSFIGAEFLEVKSVKISKDIPLNQFHFLSSPLANTTTWGNVFPENQDAIWVREYMEGNGDWCNNSTRNMVYNNKGFSYKALQPGAATFIGWLTSTEPASFLFYNNNSNNINRDGWNLLGNPYSSSIDWDLIPNDNSEAAVYTWNGYNYISWNGTIGALNEGIIPPMSAFFVRALNRGLNFLQIPKSARVHANELQTKSAPTAMLAIEVSDGTYKDKSFFRLNEAATFAFDPKFDARKLFGNEDAPQLYSESDGIALSINEFPYNGTDIEHQLNFNVNHPGKYTLYFSNSSPDAALSITFTDRLKELTFDLASLTEYEFNYNPGDNPNRFFVKFSSVKSPENNQKLQAYTHDGRIYLVNQPQQKGELRVISTSGATVFNTIVDGSVVQNFNPNLRAGVYIIQLLTADNVYSVKVIL